MSSNIPQNMPNPQMVRAATTPHMPPGGPPSNPQQLPMQKPMQPQGPHGNPTAQEVDKGEYLYQVLTLVSGLKENMVNIMENVGKAHHQAVRTSSDQTQQNPDGTQRSAEESGIEELENLDFESELFFKNISTKNLQDKVQDVEAKLGQLESMLANLQPFQIAQEFYPLLLDPFDDKNSVSANQIISSYRLIQRFQENVNPLASINLSYKRYGTTYAERKGNQYRVFRAPEKKADMEKSITQLVNSPNIQIVYNHVNDRESVLNMIMPQNFKFILNLIDHSVEKIQAEPRESNIQPLLSSSSDSDRRKNMTIFNRLEENCLLASVYFRNTFDNQLASLRHLLLWLRSFSTLFNARCIRCEKHLIDGMPPLWRDYRTYEVYHDKCRI